MKKRLLYIALPVFVLLFSLVALKKDPEDNAFEIAKNIEIFTTLYKEVNNYYVDELNPNQTMRTALDAMLKSLDPYTVFYSEDQIEDYRTMTTGEYTGIGASVGVRKGKVLVLMPMPNSPALKSGLKIGDEILQINEVKTQGKTQNEISRLLKGQAGTDLTLKIKHYGSDKTEIIQLKRELIKIDNLPISQMIDKEVGYIYLTEFTAGSYVEIQKSLKELKKQGAKSLILDLRNNPGGLLNEAVNICNLFIDKGKIIVSTKGKLKDRNYSYKTISPPVDATIPLVILVDKGSASASEIVAGAIQDLDRGVIIGQRTFGKGLVQNVIPLSYNTKLKVTIAKYYIPSGRCIQAIDYSHRNPDGSVGYIPDSLITAFKTLNGRIVYDGGGIKPDITVNEKINSSIVRSLFTKYLFFNFATLYYYQHQNIGSPATFIITDSVYNDFVAFLNDKDYDYVTQSEKDLEMFKKSAEKEKYFNNIKTEYETLKNKIIHNKKEDLITFKLEISQYLREEIVSRYFYQKGRIQVSLSNDNQIKAAVDLLNNTAKYDAILDGTYKE